MMRIYGTGFSENQKRSFIPIITANIITSIHTLLGAAVGAPSCKFVAALNPSDVLTAAIADQIWEAWQQPTVQEAFAAIRAGTYRHREGKGDDYGDNGDRKGEAAPVAAVCLTDNCDYFLDRVREVAAPGYSPNLQDILNARLMTTAVTEFHLQVEGTAFTLCDVGGQRNFRQDWHSCFDDATALVFVAAMNGYCQTLREDAGMNRLTESLNLFAEMSNNPRFAALPKLLLLNKDDLFTRSISTTPLTVCFDDYFGSGTVSDTRAFVRDKFLSRNTDEANRMVFPFFTCATVNSAFDRTAEGMMDALFKRGSYSAANLRAAAAAAAATQQGARAREVVPPEAAAVLDYWYCYENFPVAPAVARWRVPGPALVVPETARKLAIAEATAAAAAAVGAGVGAGESGSEAKSCGDDRSREQEQKVGAAAEEAGLVAEVAAQQALDAEAAWRRQQAEELLTRFGALMARAAAGELDWWAEGQKGQEGREGGGGSEGGALALLLLLLEFPRRAYHGQPAAMYAQHTPQVFRRVVRAMSPRRPRLLRHLPPAWQLWLLQLLSYAPQPERVEAAQKALFVLQLSSCWCKREGSVDQAFLSGVADDIKARAVLLSAFTCYPHRTGRQQQLQGEGEGEVKQWGSGGRPFSWTEKQYYCLEREKGGSGCLRHFEDAWPLLRRPSDIVERRFSTDRFNPAHGGQPPGPRIFLDYWFGKKLSYERIPFQSKSTVWFMPTAHTDNYLQEHLAPLYRLSLTGALDFWQASPAGTIAFHLLRSNLARVLHRNQPAMYRHDQEAVEACRRLCTTETVAVGGTVMENLSVAHQFWVVVMLSYSETLSDFDRHVLPWYDFFMNHAYWNVTPLESMSMQFCSVGTKKMRDLVQRFGRQTYKNFVLQRPLTAEEEAYYAESLAAGTLYDFEKVLPEHKNPPDVLDFDVDEVSKKLLLAAEADAAEAERTTD